MFIDWSNKLERLDNRLVLCGAPIAMHCHHYNINLQKMLEDTLGDDGVSCMLAAAERSSYAMFKSILAEYAGIKTIKSRLEFAGTLYQHCGLGVINLQDATPEGGRLTSVSSHHVTGWLAKHGLRQTPGCHFTRGWIAGALEAVFDAPLGFFYVDEIACKMMRRLACEFIVTPRKDPPWQ